MICRYVTLSDSGAIDVDDSSAIDVDDSSASDVDDSGAIDVDAGVVDVMTVMPGGREEELVATSIHLPEPRRKLVGSSFWDLALSSTSHLTRREMQDERRDRRFPLVLDLSHFVAVKGKVRELRYGLFALSVVTLRYGLSKVRD